MILLMSYMEAPKVKPSFFVSAVELLKTETKSRILTKKNTFDFQSLNQGYKIKDNNNNALLMEDCFNEIDDDGDGLIDCYDDDCAGVGVCDSFIYQYTVSPNCQFVPPTMDEFTIKELYQTDHLSFPIDQRSGVLVGDMDGDGIPELVSKDPSPGRIQIFSGVDGTIKQSIVIPTNHPFSQPAIADVDRDGNGDIFVTTNTNQLRRYEYGNPNVVWNTANNIGTFSTHCSPQIADFDHDGTPEVYVGNRVFDAITGTRLAIGTGSTGKAFNHATKNNDKWPIAFDVFAPGDPKPGGGTFGAEAQGLELIGGNQVYTYTPGNGTQDNGSLDVVSSISGGDFLDGFTSIADVDGDFLVDIVLMSAGKIYIWNPRTQTQIGNTYDVPGTNTGGRINIGDFDNDGMVEIGTAGRSIYVVLEYDAGTNSLVTKWQKTGLDDGSQRTGSTLFDFEGDGINEVVYSEEANLYIWRGTDGAELVKVPAEAGTRTEYPVVADVNNDGSAEIIITAQNGNGPGFSGSDYVRVYQSQNTPWVTARKVWNQHGYFVTNINDDLTVPIQQQNPLDDGLNNAYNGFLVQTTILNANAGGSTAPATPAFAAPDAMASIDSITAEKCPDLVVHLTITNQGSIELPATTPISFYNENPTSGNPILLGTSTIGTVLNTGETTNISVVLDIAPLCAPIEVFSFVNDPGTSTLPYSLNDFPLTGVGECDFTNNMDSFMSPICIEICGDGIDNDKDGIADEPNIMATDTSDCSGTTLPAFTTDEAGGTWDIISDIGSTITNGGIVTLGTNHSPTPNVDTIIYTGGLCSDTILVNTFDDEAPNLSCPTDQALTANGSCQATVGNYIGLVTTTDNCSATGDITLTQVPASGMMVGLGTTIITITATDEAGNQSTCQFNLVVTDDTNPTIDCPANANVMVAANCEFKLPDYTSLATVDDNCSLPANITVTQSPAINTTISGHNTSQVITLTARDESGNTANCTFTITLLDTTAPMITCPADISINADVNCEGVIGDYTSQATVMDNCTSPGAITVTQSPPSNTPLSGHGDFEVITLTAEDGNGNTSTCTFTVTLDDVTPPMLTCPSDQSLTVDANCEISVPDYTSLVTKTDNCLADASIVLTQTPAAGTTIGVLDTVVTITIIGDDTNGNTSNCTFSLTLKDEIDPTIMCPSDVSVSLDIDCKATIADYTSMATIGDNCTPNADLTVTQSPSAGQTISSPGTTTITLTVEDESGNTAQCTFDVTYEDSTNPTITCPTDVTIAVDGDCAIAIPDYTGDATIDDNCSSLANLTVTQSPVAGTMISGDGTMQIITLTIEDESGNTANCTFNVSLEDTTPPTITCPTDQNVYAAANCAVAIPDFTGATTASTCGTGNNIMVTQSPTAGTTISGHNMTQTITLTATDGSGNSNQCTFDITVLDTIQPLLSCPTDTTFYADAKCENTIPDLTGGLTYSDNCTADGAITISQSPTAGTAIAGDSTDYLITFTADDGNGNQNQCTITLSLIDTTPPTISCLSNQMLFADAGCQGLVPNYASQITIEDNCAAANEITTIQSPTAGTPLTGHNDSETITITVTDNSGNSSICTFEVVLKDTIAPTIGCPADITVNADADCEVPIGDFTSLAVIDDNCTAPTSITVSQSPAASTLLTGHNDVEIITLTADDGNGNTSTCTFKITLVDITPPVLTCPMDSIIYTDVNCEDTIPNLTAGLIYSDNCTAPGAITVTQMPMAGTPISGANTNHTITFTINDGNGNQTQCSMTLTLKDTTAPILTCLADQIVFEDANCRKGIPNYISDITATDNCSTGGGLTLTQSPPAGTLLEGHNDGETIIITATDESGNTSTCTFEVVLKDTLAPIIDCPSDITINADNDCEIAIGDYTSQATVTDNCTLPASITVTQSPAATTLLSGHNDVETITLTADDGNGNTSTCTFTITLKDNTPPDLTCPSNQTINVDANCEITIPDYTGMVTKSDNCLADASVVLTQSPAAGTTIGVLDTMVKITITGDDTHGNTDSCAFFLTLKDEIAPTITCPSDVSISLDANCQATIADYTSLAMIGDNCTPDGDLTVTQMPSSGQLISSPGTTMITLTVADESGNTATCNFEVSYQDTTNPTITCPANDTLGVDGVCAIPLPDYTGNATIGDNCSNNNLTITQSPIAGTMIMGDGFDQTVTLTVVDESGNMAQCTFIVSLRDLTDPSISCPGDEALYADNNCQVSIPDYRGEAIVSTNCTNGSSLTVTQSPPPNTTLNGHGTTQTITLTATDGSGNSMQCTFDVTVIDTIKPVLTCPADSTFYADANCESEIPDLTSGLTYTDNCTAPGTISVSQVPAAGTSISGDSTDYTITFTVDDGNGNQSQCMMVLSLIDTTPPIISCLSNQVLFANDDCKGSIPDYIAQLTIADNCAAGNEITTVQTPSAGTPMMGHNDAETVIITVTDNSGNSSICTFDVVLKDTINPSITCPSDITINADDDCEVAIGDYTSQAVVNDNCTAIGSITVTQSPATTTLLSGDNDVEVITLTADDGNGNTSTCSFTITLEDHTPPSLTCPSDSTFYADANCENTIPDLTGGLNYADNCTATGSIAVTQTPTAGTAISGDSTSYTVSFTVDDGNGNQSQCSMTVELIDTTAPNIDCISNQMIFADANCQQTIPNYIPDLNISDNCATGSNLTITQSPPADSILTGHNTSTTVIVTATDNSQNVSTCTFQLTLKDTIPPTIACPADITINADDDCEVAIGDYTSQATIADNCTTTGAITVTQSPAASTLLSGHNDMETITLTADDGNGNTSTCTFTITLKDVTPPVLTCPSNQVLAVDANCEITIPDYTSMVTKTDNCLTDANILLTQTPAAGTTIGVLDTVVKITIIGDDTYGNIDSCAFFLTLKDEIAPSITCPSPISISLDANCQATIADYTSMATIGDNCTDDNDLVVTQSPSVGTLITQPTITTITLTVEDGSGNTTNCAFDITYEDTTNPTISCPANDTISVDGDCAILLADYTNGITIADNCTANSNLVVTQSPTAGTSLSGDGTEQVVTITVEDESGNTAQCMLTVRLEDTTPPMIACPSNQILYADADCSLPIPDYTGSAAITSDCATGNGITISQIPVAGTIISGHNASQVITLTALDNSGNSSQCTFSVTVLDTIMPTLVCPTDSIIYTDANCENVIPDLLPVLGYSDNCTAIGSLSPVQSPAAGTAISGDSTSYTVTFTIDDGNGNQNQCSMTVALIDTTAPTLVCISNQIVYANTGCTETVPNYIPQIGITDDCAAANEITITQNPIAGTPLSGHNDSEDVVITVTDNSGNVSTCVFEVILKDTINPQITCPANQQIVADSDCQITLPDYTNIANFSDNCTNTSAITVTQKPAIGTVLSNLGADTTITLIADDGNGNLDSCTFLVSLIDETPPVFTCPMNQTVYLDMSCGQTLLDYRDSITVTDNCSATGNLVLTQLPAAGTAISQHDTEISVTLEATDESNNTTTCSFKIILKDTIPPSLTCPSDKVMAVDASCAFEIPDWRSEIMTTDNCRATNDIAITQNPIQGTIITNHNTTQTITFTVDDGNGNTSTCAILLTIKDSINPVIICPANQSINVGTDCEIIVPDYTNSVTISDNCADDTAITVTQSPIAGTLLSGSETDEKITLYANDGNGNIDSCDFQLSLTDTIPPVIVCPETQTIIMDNNCEFLMPDYTGMSTYDDNCLSSGVTLTQKPAPGTLLSGTDSIFFTFIIAEDFDGNLDSCDFLVVLKDTLKPTVICMGNQTVYLEEDCLYEVEDFAGTLTVTDNCSSTNGIEILQFPPEGVLFTGINTTHTITLAVVDESGNETQCNFDLTLLDTIAPVLTCPDTQYIDVDGICSIIIPDYTNAASVDDNCSLDDNITITQSPTNVSLSGDGTTQDVTLTATDESGNSTTCDFVVMLVDRTNPTVSCPGDQEIQADVNCQATIPDFTNQTIITNDCEDIANITVTQTPAAGTVMLSGLGSQQMVTITVTDQSGNQNSCDFTVSVIDTIPPMVTCIESDTLYLDACFSEIPNYSDLIIASDNCTADADIIISQSITPGQLIIEDHNGVRMITIYAQDEANNFSSCQFPIVFIDSIPPYIDCPSDTLIYLEESCELIVPDYRNYTINIDNCADLGEVTVVQDPAPGTVLQGSDTSYVIKLIADDSHGNLDSCDFNIMLEDTISPVIICPATQMVFLDGNCELALGDYTSMATITDNCSVAPKLTVTQNPVPGTIISIPNTPQSIQLTVDDGNGNTATCTFEVIHLDTIKPEIICPADQIVMVDDDCPISLPDYTDVMVSDNCSEEKTISIKQSPIPGTLISGHGNTTIVTLTATDENGNSQSCNFTLTHVDKTPPEITCPDTQKLVIGDDCQAMLPDYTALGTVMSTCQVNNFVNAIAFTIEQYPAPGTIVGGINSLHEVLLIAKDPYGNADTCAFNVALFVDFPDLYVKQNVPIETPVKICLDHPCVSPSDIRAYTKAGTSTGIGQGAGGTFQVDSLTGCVTYEVGAFPASDIDAFCIVVCDENNCCDTVNYQIEIDNYQATIVDPCVCLDNATGSNPGDGQFYEYIKITSPSNEVWPILSVSGFYENPAGGTNIPASGGTGYPLIPVQVGSTPFIEVPRGNGISDYYLGGLHVESQGYSITVANRNDTLTVSNICSYPCRAPEFGADGIPPPNTPPIGIMQTRSKTTIVQNTLTSCAGTSFSNHTVHSLYIDTAACRTAQTICPTNQWQRLKVTFSEFDLAAGDTLCVFEGQDTVRTPIAKWSGAGVSQTGGWISANCDPDLNPSGCLTFLFKTNGDNNKGLGWRSTVTCEESDIVLNADNLQAKLACEQTHQVFTIRPATVVSGCNALKDSQFVRIYNAHEQLCKDTCMDVSETFDLPFAIGQYKVVYKLKSDTAKTTTATISVQETVIVCNDEINIPMGSGCAIAIHPDDLLENPCDTITDTVYYFITLKEVDKNGQEIVLASGGGKGGNYPELTKEMMDQCSSTIVANIERRYYEGLDLAICNNGPQQVSCTVKVNIKDELAPVFSGLAPIDTLVACNLALTQTGLGLTPPEAVDNCGPAIVTFGGAEITTPSSNICDTTKAIISWIARDECGNTATATQQVVIVRPQLADIVKTGEVILACDSEAAIEESATIPSIKIGRLKNGVLQATDTIALSTSEYICGYILQYTDTQIPEVDCGRKVFRNWEVLDWCNAAAGPQAIDTTFIAFKDTKAPEFAEGAVANKVIDLDHQSCTYDVHKLAQPVATDNCSTPSVRLATVARIEDGTVWEIPVTAWASLDCDSFQLSWIAEDGCHSLPRQVGEQLVNDTVTQIIVIQDVTKPSAICADNINLAIGQQAAKLHYRAIDGGSTDACGIAKYEVSRDEMTWDSIVIFDCEDIHSENKVYLRVTDNKGNQNTCWMTVNVEDKIRPICSDLPTINLTCDEGHIGDGLSTTDGNENGKMEEAEWVDLTPEQVIAFNSKYGQPNCSDNVACEALVIEQQYQFIKKACGTATIKRRYRAIDWQGEGNISNWAEQTINVESKAAWAITLPADWKGNCGEQVPNSGITIANGACDLVGYDTEEKVFTTVEDACLKVIRTFTITNWCKYEAGGESVVISRKENEHGFVSEPFTVTPITIGKNYENVGQFTYIQILKLQDDSAPIIRIGEVDNCITNDNCEETKRFAITAQDCNEAATAALVYNWTISTNGTELAKGNTSTFDYPVAPKINYDVNWTVTDNCGNTAWETVNYEFSDCKKPAPYCIGGVVVQLMESGMLPIWASDFERGSTDNCTATNQLAYRIWHTSLGSAPNDLASVQALPEVITFDCANIGQQNINLYVIDEAGNWDFCTTSVIVQDNSNACENTDAQGMAMVSGTIMDWNQKTVENTMVTHTDMTTNLAEGYLTNEDGLYHFELAMDKAYSIEPRKNDNPLNGVSTFDLVLISKHILNINTFDNPYQYIAADANKSGAITAFDMVQIRQLILNIKTEFTNNESWRFVVAGHDFDEANPLTSDFAEVGQINNLSHDMLLDFVAVKVGDVNGNAIPNSLLIAEDRSPINSFEINTTDRYLKAGEKVSVTFATNQINDIQGYQFTLAFDNLRLEKLHSGLAGVENFGLHKMEEGWITTSWNQSAVGSGQPAVGSPQLATLFTIDFTAKQDGQLSEQLSIINQPTVVEAYAAGNNYGEHAGDLMDVTLNFTDAISEGRPFELFQNEPNPFGVNTSIGFYLPGDSEIVLTLRNEAGQILKVIKEDRTAGEHSINLENIDLPKGFIYYQLTSKYGAQAKKMLHID